MIQSNYTQAIKAIKQAILRSRYQAALLANREMLMLYFSVGEYISKNSREGKWGTNAIEVISAQLQKELPGLRGFSVSNIKNMRIFYETWQHVVPDFPNRQLSTGDLELDVENGAFVNRQLSTGDLLQFIYSSFAVILPIVVRLIQSTKTLFLPYSKNKTTLVEIGLTKTPNLITLFHLSEK